MRTPFLTLCAASVLVLAGCDDTGQLGPKTQSGALQGAVVGGLVGIVAGDDAEAKRKGAVVGAVLGATIGGTIGARLDAQAKELEAQLDDRITITNTGSELIVTMPQDILFAIDSASVRPDLADDLRLLAGSLQKYPDTTVDVFGHTDSTGTTAYNQDLSRRRAQSVTGILAGAGVDAGRLRAIGRGESQPVASNDSEEGRRLNRRVEFIIRPIQ